MLWKGTATFVGDTKRLTSGRDSPPTRIPMICHWTLSAPMSCYSPLRSSLHLSCRGQLWCTGSERRASPFMAGLFADHPFAHTHPRHLRTHPRHHRFPEKRHKRAHKSLRSNAAALYENWMYKSLLENSLLSKRLFSDEQPWNIPKYHTAVSRLPALEPWSTMSTDLLLLHSSSH